MITATIGMLGQCVPLNHPRDSLVSTRWLGTGEGGSCHLPCSKIVSGHQIKNATTITVVICMIRRAAELDSWMPLMLLRQKYSVTITPKKAANMFGSRRML